MCWQIHLIGRQVLHNSIERAELALVACCPVQAESPVPVEACRAPIRLAACPELMSGPAADLAVDMAAVDLLACMQRHGQPTSR